MNCTTHKKSHKMHKIVLNYVNNWVVSHTYLAFVFEASNHLLLLIGYLQESSASNLLLVKLSQCSEKISHCVWMHDVVNGLNIHATEIWPFVVLNYMFIGPYLVISSTKTAKNCKIGKLCHPAGATPFRWNLYDLSRLPICISILFLRYFGSQMRDI